MNRRNFFKNIGAVGVASVVVPTILMDIINSGEDKLTDNNKKLHYIIDATYKNGVFKCKTEHKIRVNDVILVTDMIVEEQFIVTYIKDLRTFNAASYKKNTNISEEVQLMAMSRSFSKI